MFYVCFRSSRRTMAYYDQTCFMELEWKTLYYVDLAKMKLLLERGIYLNKVSEEPSTFHDRLVANQWRCFSPDQCQANGHWLREFYTNLIIVYFPNPVVKIQGKEVHFGAKQINDIYGILNANLTQFEAKGCEPGRWLVEKLFRKRKVPWDAMKMVISLHDFKDKAQIQLVIICSAFINMTYVPDMKARTVSCILDNILLNVGRICYQKLGISRTEVAPNLCFLLRAENY